MRCPFEVYPSAWVFLSGYQTIPGPRTRSVPLSRLRAQQSCVTDAIVREYMGKSRLPAIRVAELPNGLFILDGHHRGPAAKKLGRGTMRARVWQTKKRATQPESAP